MVAAAMRALIVHAHPVSDSFNHAVVRAATAGLEGAGHQVTTLDLYALDYRAHMSESEWQDYESESPIVDPMVAAHVDLVRGSDALIFVYPTWWSAMPAIMRGWIERTMLMGVAFELDHRRRTRPKLHHLRHLAGISTYGSPWWYVKAVNDNGRRTVSRTLRFNASVRTDVTWLGLYGMDRRSDADRSAFLDRVEKRMGRLR